MSQPEKSIEQARADEEKRHNYLDIAFKVLAILVIPLFIWGVKLEVNNAVLSERIAQTDKQLNERINTCYKEIAERKADLQRINTTVTQNYGKLSSLSTKIDGVNTQLNNLRTLLLKLKIEK
jgi:peptidoglycan hydrolase CwlO-like protein